MTRHVFIGLLVLSTALPAWADEDHLEQWIDSRGVVHFGPRNRPSPSRVEHRWVDGDGVTHITLGPSAKARARAQRLSLIPQAGDRVERVHDVRDWDAPIAEAAGKYNIPEELVRAIIVTESNFNPDAISRAGAHGLMQLMPETGLAMYVQDLHDPVQNIFGGTRYLRILANMFDGDLVKTIAAYNAGPQAVRKAKGIPAISETQAYVRRVIKLYRIYKGLDS